MQSSPIWIIALLELFVGGHGLTATTGSRTWFWMAYVTRLVPSDHTTRARARAPILRQRARSARAQMPAHCPLQDPARHLRYLQFRSVRPFLSRTAAAAAAAASATSLLGCLRRRVWPDSGSDVAARTSAAAGVGGAKRLSDGERADYDSPVARRHRMVRRGSTASMDSSSAGGGSISSVTSLFRGRQRRRVRQSSLPGAAELPGSPFSLAAPEGLNKADVSIEVWPAAEGGRSDAQYGSAPSACNQSAAAAKNSVQEGACRSQSSGALSPAPAYRRLRSPPCGFESAAVGFDRCSSDGVQYRHSRSASLLGSDGSLPNSSEPAAPGPGAEPGVPGFAPPASESAPGPRGSEGAAEGSWAGAGRRLRRVMSGAQLLSTVWSGVAEPPLLDCGGGPFGRGERGERLLAPVPPGGSAEAGAEPPRDTAGQIQGPGGGAPQGKTGAVSTGSSNSALSGQRSAGGSSAALQRQPLRQQLRGTVYGVYKRSALQVPGTLPPSLARPDDLAGLHRGGPPCTPRRCPSSLT